MCAKSWWKVPVTLLTCLTIGVGPSTVALGGELDISGATPKELKNGDSELTGLTKITLGDENQSGTIKLTGDLDLDQDVAVELKTEGIINTDGNAGSVAGVISGTGKLTKDGGNTLTLTGVNTYEGGTLVKNGILAITADSALGAATGGLTLGDDVNKGTLSITESISQAINRAITLAGGGGKISIADSKSAELSGVISGSVGLDKEGDGTLILTGDNTYTGKTTVTEGTLQIGNGGTTGSVAGEIENKATLVFNRSNEIIFDKDITEATGELKQSGAGALTLNGAVTQNKVTIDAGKTLNIGKTTVDLTTGNAGEFAVGAGSTLGIYVDSTKKSVDAKTVTVGDDAKLDIIGYSGTTQEYTAISASGSISGSWDTTIGSTAGGNAVDADSFLYGVVARKDDKEIKIKVDGLAWNNTTANDAHGTFNIADGKTFTLGTALSDNSNVDSSTNTYVWDGKTLTKTGKGTLVLTETNNYANGTKVEEGTLAIEKDDSLGGGAVTLGSVSADTAKTGTLRTDDGMTLANDVVLDGKGGIIDTTDKTATLTGQITGNSGLTKTGAGILALDSGTASDYSGGTTVAEGTLGIKAITDLSKDGVLTLGSGSEDAAKAGTLRIDAAISEAINRAVTLAGKGGVIDTDGKDITLSEVIGGDGGLTKSGTGTLTLEGANTYKGDTTVADGTLSISADNNLGDAAGNLTLGATSTKGTLSITESIAEITRNVTLAASGGEIKIAEDKSATLGGVISSGDTSTGLTKSGAGTLALTGINTYKGGTTVAEGTLGINADAALGDATSKLTLGSTGKTGTLRIDAAIETAISRGIDLAGNGGAIDTNGNNITLSGDITGADSDSKFTKSGEGILTLTGNGNDPKGGTIVSAGTLQIGTGGTDGSILGDIEVKEDATLIANRSDAITFSGAITNNGTLQKLGAGTLTLDNDNSIYSGYMNIDAGTLEIKVGSGGNQIVSTIANEGILDFDGSGPIKVFGAISGTGELKQSGAGALTLNGGVAQNKVTIGNGNTLNIGAAGVTTTDEFSVGDGSTLGVYLGKNPSVDAGKFTIGTGAILNISGYSDPKSGTPYTVINSNSDISGDFIKVQVGGNDVTGTPSLDVFLDDVTRAKTADNRGLTVTVGDLVWNKSDNAHGTFNIADGSAFTLDTVLADSTATSVVGSWSKNTLTKTGGGTLVLDGVNTYTGGTVIKTGTLAIKTNSGLGASTSNLTLGEPGKTGTLRINGDNIELTRKVILAGDGMIDTNGHDTILSGQIDDNSSGSNLTKYGAGVLSLNNTGTASSYTGKTDVYEGTLAINAADDLGTGGLGLGNHDSAGTLRTDSDNLTLNSTISLHSGGGVIDTNGKTATLTGKITDHSGILGSSAKSGGLTKTGAGTLVLKNGGTASDYTGGVTVAEGTLAIKDDADMGAAAGTLTLGSGSDDTAKTGTLSIDAALTSARNVALTGGGGIIDTNGKASTLSGVISGSGDLTKEGVGTLTLTGDNSYTGLTTIEAGELEIGGTSDSVKMAGDFLNKGTLTVNRAKVLVIDGNITGDDGVLAQSGTGATTLNGNVKQDKVTVESGTLNIGATGKVTTTGDFEVKDGATLGVHVGDSASITAGQFKVGTGTTLDITGFTDKKVDTPYTIISSPANIAGTFNSVKVGGTAIPVTPSIDSFLDVQVNQAAANSKEIQVMSKLVWNKTNADAHGTFNIADGSSFTLEAALADNPTGVGGQFNWDGKSLTKGGLGTLILDGDSSYSGTTKIDKGKLVVKQAKALGASTVENGSELQFDFVGAFNNKITGSGALLYTDNSKVAMTGDMSGYSGTQTVDTGFLAINTVTGGNVNVLDNGTLSGTGTITGNVNVSSGGAVSPGNSIGTLRVGSVTWDSSSFYDVEVDPYNQGSSDLLIVDNTATLGGATVRHTGLNGAPGDYPIEGEWTILQAGTLSGAFNSNVDTSMFPFLSGELGYTSNSVLLKLSRTADFHTFAFTRNQHAVAHGLSGLASGSPLYNAVVGIAGTPEQVTRTYDELSGELHASLRPALVERDRVMNRQLRNRLLYSLDADAAGNGESALPVWMSVDGYSADADSTGTAGKTTLKGYDVTVGAEVPTMGPWRTGLAFRYGNSEFKAKNRGDSEADINSFNLAVYSGRFFQVNDSGKLRLTLGASYGLHDVDSTRHVRAFEQELSGDYYAHTVQLGGETGYQLQLADNFSLEPYAGANWNFVWTKSFSEDGGFAALRAQREQQNNVSTSLGLRGKVDVVEQVSFDADLYWLHTYGTRDYEVEMRFNGGNDFDVKGTPLSRDALGINLGTSWRVTPAFSLEAGYQGVIGDSSSYHGGSLNLVYRF